MKKLVAFDLDGTLASSKSKVPEQVVNMLKYLIERYEVCIISGGGLPQFEKQLFSSEAWAPMYSSGPRGYHKLHIMPTCGAQYYIFTGGRWVPVYKEEFTSEERDKIISNLDWVIAERQLDKLNVYGSQVEDRGSQITFSALGQAAPVLAKEKWDPNGTERQAIKKILDMVLPEFEIRVGGSTSIDITKRGIDKAFGIRNMFEYLDLTPEEVIFFGDKLDPGGNDYPVKQTGVECIAVADWQDTIEKVKEKL